MAERAWIPLVYKTKNGARVGDLFMSLIHSAELAGVNPFDYLTALLSNTDQMARDPGQWLPWNYSAASGEPARQTPADRA